MVAGSPLFAPRPRNDTEGGLASAFGFSFFFKMLATFLSIAAHQRWATTMHRPFLTQGIMLGMIAKIPPLGHFTIYSSNRHARKAGLADK
jgi:hypothetical protein